jgi:signal transduction histidine kinase
LSRVLVNFINNALLHAFEGRTEGRMRLSAKLLDGDQIELVFADDGVGMPADVLHRIFDPFYTTKLGRGGSGLGMHIAYSIITVMHGGHLEVTSKHGHGAQFRCVLPVKAPQRADGLARAGEVGADGTALA